MVRGDGVREQAAATRHAVSQREGGAKEANELRGFGHERRAARHLVRV